MSTPAPILEWHVSDCTDNSCFVHVELLGAPSGDVSKLTLQSGSPSNLVQWTATPILCDEHWTSGNAAHWMWKDAPHSISLDVEILWTNEQARHEETALDILWEHVYQGERESWNLGSVEFPAQQESRLEFQGHRKGQHLSTSEQEIELEVVGVPKGAFVKWTEYIPEGCVCEVLEASGASIRKTQNAQIFLWFEVADEQILVPKYRLTCAQPPTTAAFDGEVEVAFGTEAKTLHIAEVEWAEGNPALNENMKLNPLSGSPSVQPHSVADNRTGTPLPLGLQFSVQLLANHRDLEQGEMSEWLGYTGSFHTVRHEGWHKYLTDAFATYREAREMRSHLWTTTKASDAFVTASLDDERITVQEALLMSNQSWIP